MVYALFIVGSLLVVVGVALIIKGKGDLTHAHSNIEVKGVKVTGPTGLVLTTLGAGLMIGGIMLDQRRSASAPETAAVASPSSPAAGKPPKAVQPVQERNFADLMAEAEALEHDEEWPDAWHAFEAALKAKPGDVGALIEVGWTALHAHQLERAREASTLAILGAVDPLDKARALYGLGRAMEKQDPHAAIALYRAAYLLRPADHARDLIEERMDAVVTKHGDELGTAEGNALLDQLRVLY